MSERKVINKYYPPDYDPSKIVKKKKKVKTGSAALPTVRLMTPFSMKCINCGEYISKSRKFNARKEVLSQKYLNINYIGLHIRCPRCAGEIFFRTDPASGGYVIESGAKKNYDSANTNQLLREETSEEILSRLEKEEQEAREKELKSDKKQTTLEELEAKVNDMKHQQEISDELENIREKNKRLNESYTDSKISEELKEKSLKEGTERKRIEDEEDELLANAIFGKRKISQPQEFSGSDSASDSDGYDQPITTTLSKKTVAVKKKHNLLGVSVKRVRK